MRLSVLILLSLALVPAAWGAPKADLWPRWQAHDEGRTTEVDHAAWAGFLEKYLVTDTTDGIHRVRYAAVAPADRATLAGYIARLENVQPTGLSRAEQKAYWINLYNAVTVREILDHYPVKSIKEIKSGWFNPGPWDKKLVTVEGEKMTLNDIEHRILRPIFADPRVHYGVVCASLGCPDLQPVPFTADNTDTLLDEAARAYINHPRGARFEGGTLHLSSIYDWFQADFGGSEAGVLAHLRRYAEGTLADRLAAYTGALEYGYDWSLNEYEADR